MPATEGPPSTADRALLRAARAWGPPGERPDWGRFEPGWAARLRAAWPSAERVEPDQARDALRSDHRASARPEISRIHPSWIARALQAESPAVRRAVVAHGPPAIRGALGDVTPRESPSPTADPEAIAWALALWAERLIGDVAVRDDDPPVVVALTRMRLRDVARLVKACGQVKHAFAIEGHGPSGADEAVFRMNTNDRVRVAFFRRKIGVADPRLVPSARADLAAIGDGRHRAHSRLGLLTIGRLLAWAEPYRARWAMQHLPYPVVKQMRDPSPPLPPSALATWESWVLEAAWARLLAEGRLVGHRDFPS